MIGKIHLLDKKNNKVINSYYDDELYSDENRATRVQIKDNFLNKYKDRYTLICSCNNSIELYIDSMGRIYHKNKSDLEKHDKLCKRHIKHKEYFSKGWTNKDDIIIATLNFNVLPNTKNIKLKNNKDAINIKELTKKINLEASNKHISNQFEMLNRVYTISKNIHIDGFKKSSLQDFYFNAKKFKGITSNSPKFVYMYISQIEEIDNNYITIKCEYAPSKFFSFLSKRELLHKEYLSKNISKSKNPIVISGFIHKSDRGLEFYQLSLIRVNSKGLY